MRKKIHISLEIEGNVSTYDLVSPIMQCLALCECELIEAARYYDATRDSSIVDMYFGKKGEKGVKNGK